jgi:transposase
VVLTRSRCCLLTRPEKFTDHQSLKLEELLSYNLRTIRAYLLKEEFQLFWEYVSPAWAEEFTGRRKKVKRSRIEPMKKTARMIRGHKPLILNWFQTRGRVSLGAVECLNRKRISGNPPASESPKAIKIMLCHKLGELPESQLPIDSADEANSQEAARLFRSESSKCPTTEFW